MNKYKKYYGLFLFLVVLAISVYYCVTVVKSKYDEVTNLDTKIQTEKQKLTQKRAQEKIVKEKIKKIKDSVTGSAKKIYTPMESDLGNDSLFFALYNDMLKMITDNSIKIKAIKYAYNPSSDNFVKLGRGAYFVCDVDLELVSNYVNLGKLVQDLYQYPYYIKMNSLEVLPYHKDKKILLSKLSLRLYARTEPDETMESTDLTVQ